MIVSSLQSIEKQTKKLWIQLYNTNEDNIFNVGLSVQQRNHVLQNTYVSLDLFSASFNLCTYITNHCNQYVCDITTSGVKTCLYVLLFILFLIFIQVYSKKIKTMVKPRFRIQEPQGGSHYMIWNWLQIMCIRGHSTIQHTPGLRYYIRTPRY